MPDILDLLHGEKAAVIVGVHTAMGAKIAEEAGVDGLWISSFEVHAAARLPDADILGTQDYLEIANRIVDRVQSPVLVDGNAGGGNAINTIRLVREFHKAGTSGICLEDNVFPKRCTFYDGMQDDIEKESTFCGKLDAALDSRPDDRFAVIARTEALTKGLGMDVALARCHAYAERGVDAILIHHKGNDKESVLEFAEKWRTDHQTPLVCVPTTYGHVSYDELNDAGFRLIIMANAGIRAQVQALQQTMGGLMAHKRLADVEDQLVPMSEIFRLVYVDELRANEDRYVR
ncbi:MAG: Phosphoenolpyruvate phosphomutase [Frankiales bacterium]|nr:Phosphoenolpyruvate phosphomutase [Frankiales bacterium]